jgi:hypothetical protein
MIFPSRTTNVSVPTSLHVVGSLCCPQNVSIVTLDELLLHVERGSGFSKLRKERLEKRLDRVDTPERSIRREEDSIRRISQIGRR